ncbi:hypothetical protein PHYPSEUDO_014501 [Phytophthora pseudosyringae]|uniref:Uncharacterized protein n=1 Tax=Phytophthora pseudosyringae TaxID=221518 RepID=A0A8T1V597_9STRA|nr:hypothetical protein PHYPSEUDO_014501 [Phytophthora pseudosyringae]
MHGQITEMGALMESMKTRQDEEYAAMYCYQDGEDDVMALRSVAVRHRQQRLPDGDFWLEVEVEIGPIRLTKLVDTGCTRFAIDKNTLKALQANVELEPEIGSFRNADGSVGQTTDKTLTTFKMLTFSICRTFTYAFRVADTLLYPMMTNCDFLCNPKCSSDMQCRAEVNIKDELGNWALEKVVDGERVTG